MPRTSKSDEFAKEQIARDPSRPLVMLLEGRTISELEDAKKLIDQLINEQMVKELKIGQRVLVPFGRGGSKNLEVEVYGITKNGVICERIDGKKWGQTDKKEFEASEITIKMEGE
jgi:hypothetical protein